MRHISYYIGLLFLTAILFIGGILFSTLYLNLVNQRTNEVVLGLLNRGNTHRDVLEESFHAETLEHVSLMESASEFTVVITDQKGKILKASHPLTPKMKVELIHTEFQTQRKDRILRAQAETKDFLMTDSPITISGVHRGHVFMFAPETLIQQVVNPLRQQFIQVGIIAVLLSLATVVLCTRLISRPLIEMERATAKLKEGNLDVDLPVNRSDELGALARSITQLAKDLDFLNRERTEFLANISHELRTPLTYMKGYADILHRPNLPESEKTAYLSIIKEESDHLSTLIEQLMLLARSDTNAFSVERVPLALDQLIVSTTEKMRPAIEEKGLHLHVSGEPVEIAGDEIRLKQVLINVLDNAKKYTATGEIVVRYGRNETGPYFQVRDTGSGISQESLPHVTKRLYRSEPSRSRSRGGSGLGLTIALAIVQAHDATLDIKSEKNAGTSVMIQWKV
ncbi:HAMP domain-containing histidine kinase [Exiguobacterium sp. Helios]|uniref:sensor histidine kinase n=1 Tax=unclassified Exiguobacterium TaxID=2644629 RepID=UPI00103AEFF5|nr:MULTISPECIES: HAMP domain-containing sensor histidine kinase [unclassified Exiguobacterium]QNR20156.1 HAMP domain-containing histidine kinase [Exiguobacterium sp. Helios]